MQPVTIRISLDAAFTSLQLAHEFLAEIEPHVTKYNNVAAPSTPALEAPAKASTDFDKARIEATDAKQSIADQIASVKPARVRRTKEQIAADTAASEAAAKADAPEIDPMDAPIAAPAALPEMSLDELRPVFLAFTKRADAHKEIGPVLLKYGAVKASDVKGVDRRAFAAELQGFMKA